MFVTVTVEKLVSGILQSALPLKLSNKVYFLV